MSESNGDIGAFFAGFIIGGLVGAATALIMAPQSGEETRNRLMERSQEWRELGEDRLGPVRERAGGTLDEIRQRAQTAGTEVQERSRIVLSEGKARLSQIKRQPDQAADDSGEDSAEEE